MPVDHAANPVPGVRGSDLVQGGAVFDVRPAGGGPVIDKRLGPAGRSAGGGHDADLAWFGIGRLVAWAPLTP